jgi:hypothetical protein
MILLMFFFTYTSDVRFYALKGNGNHIIVDGAKMLDCTSVDVIMMNLLIYRVFLAGVPKNWFIK